MIRGRPAVVLATIAAAAAAAGACTNDYDALGTEIAGGTASSGAETGPTTSTTTTTVGSGGGAGAGGTGPGGGADGGGGAAPADLPGSTPCDDLALDFTFDVDTDLPDPWRTAIAGQVDLTTENGLLLLELIGAGRDRGALEAPAPAFVDCSVTVSVPEPPRWSGPTSTLAAAFIRPESDGEAGPALVVMSGVDAAGEPTSSYVGAVDLAVGTSPLVWSIGPIERAGVSHLRLREAGGSLHYDVSADGIAWEVLGSLDLAPDGVAVGGWKDGTLQPEELVTVVLGPVNP